jgi:hypothetical protein
VQVASSEYYTPAEVAGLLKLSTDTIIRQFSNRAGVIRLGHGESRFKRKYQTLRIPREALDKFIIENRVERVQ